jgi:DNA polymerase elongation subunit (family B)
MIDNPKLKITGIEVVRTSTPACVRTKLKECLELIFKESTNEDLLIFITKFKKEFANLPFEIIGMPRGVNFKGQRKVKGSPGTETFMYNLKSKSLPIAVRAACLYNKALNTFGLEKKYPPIVSGDKIKFAYVKVPNILGTDIFGCLDKMPKELVDKFVIDYEVQFQKTFLAPLTKIFNSIGWYFETDNNADGFFEED